MSAAILRRKQVNQTPDRYRYLPSFVLRGRHFKKAQKKAWDKHWKNYQLPETSSLLANSWLAADTPLTVEAGFGNGETLVSLAQNNPDENFLGVEVFRSGIARLMMRAEELGLKNLKIFHGDTRRVFAELLPAGSCARMLILFPDPWPKRRHHKRRLVSPDLLPLLEQVLGKGALLYLVTDERDYADYMLGVLHSSAHLRNLSQSKDGFCRPPHWWVSTRFEAKALKKGRATCHLQFQRV